jgi:hypothetical protein
MYLKLCFIIVMENYNVEKDVAMEHFRKNDVNKVVIIEKIKNKKYDEIFDGLCCAKENSIILHYSYFKHFAMNDTYDIILQFIVSNIENVLKNNETFSVHVNANNLSITDVDKHRSFILKMSQTLSEKFPYKLHKCYIYDAPFIFSQVFSIVSKFIDKETQRKIHVVNNR